MNRKKTNPRFVLSVLVFLLVSPTALLCSLHPSAYYRNRLNYSPHYFFYQRSYILALVREQKMEAAVAYLRTLARKKRAPRALLLRGIFFAHTGRIQKAKAVWRRYWPHALRGHPHLEREYNHFKMKAEAFAFYRYLAGKHPKDPALLKKNLLYSLQLGSVKESLDLLIRFWRLRPRYLQGLDQLISGAVKQPAAQSAWLKGLGRHRKKLGPLTFRLLCRWRQYPQAAALLKSLYRDRLRTAEKIASLARILLKEKQSGLYRKVLALLPAAEVPVVDRLNLAGLLEKSDPGSALRLYRGLSNNAAALRGVARILLSRGDLSGALRSVQAIRRPEAKDQVLLGKIFALQKNAKKAIRAFSRIPQPARGIHTAIALFITGSKPEEIKLPLQAALKRIPGDGSALPGLELLYRLQFYTLTGEQKKDASRALRYRWMGRPGRTGEVLEKLGRSVSGRAGSRILLEAAALALSREKYRLAEGRLNLIISGKMPLLDRALYRLAQLYRGPLRQRKRARGLLMRLVANYPGSLYIYESRRELSEWKQ